MAQTSKVRGVKTKVFQDGQDMVVKYHSTHVVVWNDMTITLNSGGWQSATTKTRMNQASAEYGLGYGVFQKNYEWFVEYKGQVLPFVNGMTLTR